MNRTRKWKTCLLNLSSALSLIFFVSFFPNLPGLPHVLAGTAYALEVHTCTPDGVMAADNRIHVRCANAAPGGIYFFAYPTSDSPKASRILSILSTALASGRTLTITYDPSDTSGADFGCAAGDCRTIISVEFWR